MKHQEYEIQKAVTKYISLQYPNIIFFNDYGSGVNKTRSQIAIHSALNQKSFKMPDLFIIHPKNGYAGLFIELKKETPFYKGQYCDLKKDARIEAQSRDLTRLNIEGYFCAFAWSTSMAIAIIDYYMSEKFKNLPNIEPHTEYFYEFFDR